MARATARLRATVWGELLAEFLGTLVLIAFGDGVVAMAVAALNQSGRGTEIFAASGRLAADRLGMGAGGRPGPGRQARLPLAQGGAVHGGPGAGGVRRGRARVPRLPRRHLQLRGGQAHHPGDARRAADSTPTFSIFATFPAPYFGSSMIGPLIDQIVGTAFLLMFVLALTDGRRPPQCGQRVDPGAVAEAPLRK